ncbi:hypothetical protein ACVIAJ_04015 [Acinetobacter johnsonii]|uniref:Uncharacterized protein n=1 Tax=Acinetobacter johnsonii TaxID=40214 RepID=A0A1R7QGB6_ACIJO|nr:hypothetical protein [Acinetobacter johnsonii]SJX23332.1 hypothetical protein ACNJC6_02992 [Acinetobacter johnsonii]
MQFNTPQPLPVNTPKEFENFSFREIQCAWNYCCNNGWVTQPLINTISIDQKRIYLETYLNGLGNRQNIIDQIISYQKTTLIDYSYFNWIDEEDKRLIHIILTTLASNFNIPINIGLLPKIFDELIITFDALPYDMSTKIHFITNQRDTWGQIRTKDSELNWLDHNNTTQLNWAWEYLGKFNKRINANINPIENNDLLCAIQASFDFMSHGYKSDKVLFLDRMKKTWSQKKFRDSGKAKKNYHIPLTKTTQMQLEKLAEFKNLRKDQVIEELILKEYEATQLDEKGKNKYFR